jgi:hypothetical protein
MENTTASSIFTTALKGAEASREKARKDNTFTTLMDVKDSFRLTINESQNKIKFIQYKNPNADAIRTTMQELEVLKEEYELADEAEGSEHMELLKYSIYMCEKRLQGYSNTEMEIGVWIDSEGESFTKEELEKIAYTICNSNPYGDPYLYGKY